MNRKYCDCQAGLIPRPASYPDSCKCKPNKITLRTVTIPANLGTDTKGEAYAPKAGAYYNTLVFYLANGAVYLYDSNGVYTNIEPGGYQELVTTVNGFTQSIDELYNPGKIGYMVKSVEALKDLAPTIVPADEFVLVTEDETHNGRPSLYSYDPGLGSFVYAYPASPYYQKPFIDSVVDALQTNINMVYNKEVEDVNNLQTNINVEANERKAADTALNDRITEIVNSPDVRFIVDTYADLEGLDKTGIGDKDYARVLQDETHDNASTYYQFSLADQSWGYVGQTGPYYTKTQIDEQLAEYATIEYVDEKIGDIDTALTELNTGSGV